jgi:putative two-component system response regulator
MESMLLSSVTVLSHLEKLKDRYHRSHSLGHRPYLGPHEHGVARLTYMLCRQMGMSLEKSHQTSIASGFHDIGKIVIPDNIILKPDALTTEEQKIIREHTIAGYEILMATQGGFLTLAAQIALEHHEKYDGSGYPKGLREEQISLEARIVTVCDYYDALRQTRPYKKAMSHQEAIELMMLEQYTFDPVVLKAFLSMEELLKKEKRA